MLRVGRVGSYPDVVNAGIGKWAYEIMKHEDILSFVYAPTFGAPHLRSNRNVIIKSFKSFNFLPKNRSFLIKFLKYIQTFYLIIFIQIRAIFWLSSKELNLVHLHSQMYFLVLFWAKVNKIPCVLTFHGEDFNYLLNNRVLKFLVKLPDLITVISPEMLTSVKEISGNKNTVYIPNGVDLSEFPDYKQRRENLVLLVAAWKPVKRHMSLIKAFELLLQEDQYASHKLVIAGDGPLFEQGRKYIEVKGLEEHIILLGAVDKSTLVEYYNKSKLSVLCSEREGFPKVVLESMACGCPVLCTKVGAVEQLFGVEYPNYIEDVSPEPFKKALQKALETPLIMKDIVSNYTWIATREQMFNEYKNILNS